jgi:hypothetical protein
VQLEVEDDGGHGVARLSGPRVVPWGGVNR